MAARKNCWEIMQCGRHPGGDRLAELGECPAVRCFGAHGIHNGINGGRACWAIAGTYCGGETQGSFVDKVRQCSGCRFFHQVRQEETAGSFVPAQDILVRIASSS